MENSNRCPACGKRKDYDLIHHHAAHCPERIPQPQLPSGNSTFPPKELAEIKECIEQANELLLALGLDNEENEINLRSYQLTLRKMQGEILFVTVLCKEEELQVKGKLKDAGLNFIVLETEVKNFLLIPTERILLLEHREKSFSNSREQELLCINDDLRQDLMLHFSEVVSKSPFLLNLFFGLSIELFLESFIGCVIYARTDFERKEIEGTLTRVDKGKIDIVNIDHEKQGIDFDELCYIEIEREAFSGWSMFEEI